MTISIDDSDLLVYDTDHWTAPQPTDGSVATPTIGVEDYRERWGSPLRVIHWITESVLLPELVTITGLSRSTLYRMYDDFATARTYAKLEPLLRELAHAEAEEAKLWPR